jgi:hypothetical protein
MSNSDSLMTLFVDSLPLDEFLEQYYKDYPESIADLTIYQVCDRPRSCANCSVIVGEC